MATLVQQGALLRTTAGLEPYTGIFGRREAAHLLRRTTFAPRYSEITEAVDLGLQGTVDKLLNSSHESTLPDPPGAWANELALKRPLTNEQQRTERDQRNDTRKWWLRLMSEYFFLF